MEPPVKYSNWILNDTILYEISQKVCQRLNYFVEHFLLLNDDA